MIALNEKDQELIEKKGISLEKIEHQIETFKEGIPFIQLVSAATVDKGIHKFSDEEKEALINFFDEKKNNLSLLKFVPASGAATRMFKSTFKFLEKFDPNVETFKSYVNREKAFDMETFFVGYEKLPFYSYLIKSLIEKYPTYFDFSDDLQRQLFIKEMLAEDGFNYGAFPKGLLPFHKYKTHSATAFEEHLYEAALYDAVDGKAKLHFTISENHSDKFDEEFNKVEKIVEGKTGTSFEISFSYQKSSTDTIAVTLEDEPFRDSDGSILFRPGGHGALIENLDEHTYDVIFIKNIDNVVTMRDKLKMINHKKMLAGVLLKVQEKAFNYAKLLDEATETISEEILDEIRCFITNKLNVAVKEDYYKYMKKYKIEYLKEKINRPIRVCGMVKNEGEPGGGPFWIKNEHAEVELQIIESAQIDNNNKRQRKIMQEATHFNPVDIVCGVKNYKGEKYDLLQFVDHKQAFITNKTREGREVKALELPGLWNGAMAKWNSVFVEVPLVTFNPVKTVNDLLKPSHQVRLD
ncbi:DUF4301 family protein [Zhouia sp. PK063]|uniref:DUF4301 family protein n=1 Tax=Zhouia sp. PK063 TaxID=3373602 RepID=UPI0037A8DDB9